MGKKIGKEERKENSTSWASNELSRRYTSDVLLVMVM